MKQILWMVSYLIDDGEGMINGFKTVVEAEGVYTALVKAQVHIHDHYNVLKTRYFITDIGLADEESRIHMDEVMVDPLAEDYWPI